MSIRTVSTRSELRRDVRREQGSGEGYFLWVSVGFIAFIALGLSLAGLYFPSGGDGTSRAPKSAAGKVTEQVTLGEMFARPSLLTVDAGTTVTLLVNNRGKMAHDLKVNGITGTEMLAPGRKQTLDLGVVTKDLILWCTVAGHKEAGMVMTIRVKPVGGSQDIVAVAAAAPDVAASASSDAVIDFSAKPGVEWKRYDPALKPAPGGTEHKLTFRATEKVIEVAPGITQEMWTFNDVVPGPTLRGKVGDLFTVTLVNEGKVDHSIDFHSSKVAWNDEMRSIKTGESLTYQYVAKHAGFFMYHCGTAPALHHIGNGMYGGIMIDPPVLNRVDHEFVLVQSELYTGAQGKPGNLTKMMAADWDAVVFNGYVNQYLHRPIRVEPNQRVRVWVLDAGPSENSAFHIVGTIFDTVFKAGTYVLQPDSRQGGAQALDLGPSQGGFVEFTFDEAGLYPIVTHKFANVGKGALGLFQAGEITPAEGGTH